MATSFRDIKKEARKRLHERLRVSALYIAPDDTITPVTVRIHTSTRMYGDLVGAQDVAFAQTPIAVPEILFWLDEGVMPQRGGIVSVEEGEAYRVDYTHPPDDVTIKAQIVRLEAEEAEGLPVPS